MIRQLLNVFSPHRAPAPAQSPKVLPTDQAPSQTAIQSTDSLALSSNTSSKNQIAAVRALVEAAHVADGGLEDTSRGNLRGREALKSIVAQIEAQAMRSDDPTSKAVAALASNALASEADAGSSPNATRSARLMLRESINQIEALLGQAQPKDATEASSALKAILDAAQEVNNGKSHFGASDNYAGRQILSQAFKQMQALVKDEPAAELKAVKALVDTAVKIDGVYSDDISDRLHARYTLESAAKHVQSALGADSPKEPFDALVDFGRDVTTQLNRNSASGNYAAREALDVVFEQLDASLKGSEDPRAAAAKALVTMARNNSAQISDNPSGSLKARKMLEQTLKQLDSL